MNKNSWIIIVDERRIGGMLAIARKLGGNVTAVVVGDRPLADIAAKFDFDRVLCLETSEGIPAEAYTPQIASLAKSEAPGFVLSSDAPASRILLGAVAEKLDAALISNLRALFVEEGRVVVSRSAAEGKVLEDIEVQGSLAVIFNGDDVESPSKQPIPVERVSAEEFEQIRLIETLREEGGAGLLTAKRVVGAGMGLINKDDVKLIEEFAEAIGAEVACTLPVCDDMRWFPSNRVVGSSYIQITPELYIAVGISGQPQHMSGARDAKIIVAVNNDPEAMIFRSCDYGILGDLHEVVPALITAFKSIG